MKKSIHLFVVTSSFLVTPQLLAQADQNAGEVKSAIEQVSTLPTVTAPASSTANVSNVTRQLILPKNSEVLVSLNEDLTTKGKKLKQGDKFDVTVTHDVLVNGLVAIPKGAPGTGTVTWMTSKGAFGKSGKMDVTIDYVEFGGQRVAVDGKFRQEGEGNTVGTVAGVVAAGVFAAFITGKSALIPAGRELTTYTKDDFAVADNAPVSAPAVATVPSTEETVAEQVDEQG